MKKKFYKVTTEIKGIQHSCLFEGGIFGVQYSTEKWAKAPEWLAKKGYHLFAFDSLENAKKYIPEVSGMRQKIWECEIKKRFKKLPPYLDLVEAARGRMIPAEDITFPEGTVMVREVKLIRKVWG